MTTKLIEKIADPSDAKEYHDLKKKKTKLIKRSKIITQQPKNFENTNIVNIKSVTLRQPENVFQVGSGKSSNNPL